MVAFGHTAVGAGIGLLSYQLIGQTTPPLRGLVYTGIAGVVSHYLIDLIPHGHFSRLLDKEYKRQIFPIFLFDFVVSVVIFLLTAYHSYGLTLKTEYILFGIGGSQLPDILDNLHRLKLLPFPFLFDLETEFHEGTHWHGRGKRALLIGSRDVWQLMVILLVIILIMQKF